MAEAIGRRFDRRLIMANPTASESSTAESSLLRDLQSTLEREIPMCAKWEFACIEAAPQGLVMWLPLGPNRNHQQTAFAGSLNAVCTIAGWGTVFLLLKDLGRKGNIVIRRSTIRYHQPVNTAEILAHCQAVTPDSRKYFLGDARRQAAGQARPGSRDPGPGWAAGVFQWFLRRDARIAASRQISPTASLTSKLGLFASRMPLLLLSK